MQARPRAAPLSLALLALLLLALLPSAAPPARAQGVPPDTLALLGRVNGLTPSILRMDGDRAYLAGGSRLTIAELGPDDSATLRGAADLPRPIADVAVSDGFAYLITRYSNLETSNLSVVDATNPASPQVTLSLDFTADDFYAPFVGDVGVYGGRLYLTISKYGGEGALLVYSLANPASPSLESEHPVGTVGTSFTAPGGLSFVDDRLYISTGEIFTISGPVTRVGTFAARGGTVVAEGGYLYVGSGQGLSIFEKREPNPLLRGEISAGQGVPNFTGLIVEDERLYVAASNVYDAVTDLHVYDVSNRLTPRLLGKGAGPALSLQRTSRGFYGINGYGLYRYDVSDPAAIVAKELLRWELLPIGNYNVVQGGRLYSFRGNWMVGHTLAIADVSDPARPAVLGRLSLDAAAVGEQQAFAVAGGRAALLHTLGTTPTLQLFDVGDPANPVAGGSLALDGVLAAESYWLTVAGDTLTVEGRVRLSPVSNPTGPFTLATVDIADLNAPRLVRAHQIDGMPIYVAGDVAVLIQLLRVNLYDAASGELRGLIPVSGVTDLALRGETLYLAHRGGLQIVDISDPALPEPLGSYTSKQQAEHRLALRGDRAYLYAGTVLDDWNITGLQLLDVSDPAATRLIASLEPDVLGIAFDGDVAILRHPQSIQAIEPASGKTCCVYQSYTRASDIVVDGGRVYLFDDFARLHVLQAPERYDFPPDIYLPLLRR